MANGIVVKAITVIDLSRYSDICKVLEQHIDATAVAGLNGQLQSLIQAARVSAGIKTHPLPFKNTGDGAIIVLDTAELGVKFAEALHKAAESLNADKDIELAQRHFRVGLFKGNVVLSEQKSPDGYFIGFEFAGSSIGNAVRLEDACKTGEILINEGAWNDLPDSLKLTFGKVETVKGKRSEAFQAHRRRIVPPAPWDKEEVKTVSEKKGADENQALIEIHKRRLNHLKRQQAMFGAQTPPATLMEIEDIERIVQDLQK
jgi:class 3 adenylate cyclase